MQGAFAGAIYGLQPAYLTERFPTEVRGTASAFCYHFGTILGGLVPPTITYLAVDRGMGFPEPMLYGMVIGAVIAVVVPGDKGHAVHVRGAGEVAPLRGEGTPCGGLRKSRRLGMP